HGGHACFSADGRRVLAIINDGTFDSADCEIATWNAATGEPVGPVIRARFAKFACFLPDNRILILRSERSNSGAPSTLQIWDPVAGKPLGEPVRLAGVGVYFSFDAVLSPDGRLLAISR